MRAKEFITEADTSAREKFLDRVVGPESGGKSWVQNKRSGATGLFQFMPDTWAGVVKKAKPGDPHYGMSFDQMRNSPEAQRAAANQISREYEATIKRNNMPDTPTSYYLLHGHGPKGVAIYNNPDKQLKDIYPEFVKDKQGNMVRSIVYRQNPNFDPNQKLSDFVAARAAKMGDKMSDLYPGRNTQLAKNQTTTPPQDNALKKQITNVGTNVLGGLVGAKDAKAGDLPPEKMAALKTQTNKPGTPTPSLVKTQGEVGSQLAQTSGGQFMNKADRLNQEKVNATLGMNPSTGQQYKAGSKEANLALQQKFKQTPAPVPAPSASPTTTSNDAIDLANKYGADSYVAQAAASSMPEPNSNTPVTKEAEGEKALNRIKNLARIK